MAAHGFMAGILPQCIGKSLCAQLPETLISQNNDLTATCSTSSMLSFSAEVIITTSTPVHVFAATAFNRMG